MKLSDVIDYLSIGDTDSELIAEDCARKYGIGADEVLAEKQRRIEVIEHLNVITEWLTETQTAVLFMTGAGYRQSEIGEKLGLTERAVRYHRREICSKLQKESDEDRIQFLRQETDRLSKTSRGRHSKLYHDYIAELLGREQLRKSLKELFVLLTPPQSTKEADSKLSMPAYTFERCMQIGEGMREGIERGRKVMKTIVRCHVPEYFKDTFGDKYTCCTLCATCSRKKDVVGRAGYDKYGLEKPAEV